MRSATKAKARGLWLSGKLLGVSLKGKPWLLVRGRETAAAPGGCWLEPFAARRNRQQPALRGIQPQSLTSGAFKEKKPRKSHLVLMSPFFRGS